MSPATRCPGSRDDRLPSRVHPLTTCEPVSNGLRFSEVQPKKEGEQKGLPQRFSAGAEARARLPLASTELARVANVTKVEATKLRSKVLESFGESRDHPWTWYPFGAVLTDHSICATKISSGGRKN